MRTVIRAVTSAVVGFFLMWPLGYVYGVLHWPTFHSWGLMHGAFFSAWPTLSILTFLALGYTRLFPLIEDTPLLFVGLAWGLLLTGFLGTGSYLSTSARYALLYFTLLYFTLLYFTLLYFTLLYFTLLYFTLLAITAAIVAVLSFFARHRLYLTLFVVSPIVLFGVQFLIGLMSQPTREFKFLVYYAFGAFDHVKWPLIVALLGWAIGSVAHASMRRPTV
ncbi:MAG: hypothetical protein J2P50_00190 [Hyphomicrobiaceae bacterium]|nr:hypothetical protein [Hyphomicrobiaceae bacterium]